MVNPLTTSTSTMQQGLATFYYCTFPVSLSFLFRYLNIICAIMFVCTVAPRMPHPPCNLPLFVVTVPPPQGGGSLCERGNEARILGCHMTATLQAIGHCPHCSKSVPNVALSSPSLCEGGGGGGRLHHKPVAL